MLAAIYAEAKGWQALIGSAFGFIALLSGALFNAHLNRRRDDRLRSVEAKTVAISLFGEIVLLRRDIAKLANAVGRRYVETGFGDDDMPEYFSDMFRLREPAIFNSLASQIGLLPPGILADYTQFYSDYNLAVENFPRIIKNNDRKISFGVEWFLEPAINATERILDTLHTVAAMGYLYPRPDKIDLGKARSALALAQSLREE